MWRGWVRKKRRCLRVEEGVREERWGEGALR
jgi:hypothetical protein